jgi:hypothetical protein
LALSYAQGVINGDWPQMAQAQVPEKSVEINKEMWEAVMSVRAASPAEQTAEDHVLSELVALSPKFQNVSDSILLIRREIIKSSVPSYWQQVQ